MCITTSFNKSNKTCRLTCTCTEFLTRICQRQHVCQILPHYQWYHATFLTNQITSFSIASHLIVQICYQCDTYTSTRSTFTPQGSVAVSREDCNNKLQEHQKNIFITLHTLFPSLLTYLGNQPQQYWILYFCFTTNQKKSTFQYFHSGLLFKISMKAFLSASSSHQCNKKE